MSKYCTNCGSEMQENSAFCSNCGAPQNGQQTPNAGINQTNNSNGNYQPKSKIVAGLLGIFLGSWGIHNFYLGNINRGVIQIVVTIVTCGIGGIWGFIEGIMILTGSINTDANGVPLVD